MKCQREKFNLQRKVAYLNCAYMSPLLKKVEKAGIEGIKSKRKPFHITPEDFFNDRVSVREQFSRMIGAGEANRIAIIPSVSYGMANVIKNLPRKKGRILLVSEQFPSNVYPWMEEDYEIEFVEVEKGEQRGKRLNEKLLSMIDKEVAAVSIGHIHWADGTLMDLSSIRMATQQSGSALIIDGTQSVGALPFSVEDYQPDALICAGYKWLMGPYSIGVAYYGEMFDDGKPIENNWISRKNSENFGGLVSYQKDYQKGALRYDVGEHSNFVLLPMLKKALKQVNSWSPIAIQTYCEDLTSELIPELQKFGYKIEDPAYRSSHLFGIRMPDGLDGEKVKKQLKAHKVNVSFRGDAIRVSPHLYNDQKDVGKLYRALKSAVHQ